MFDKENIFKQLSNRDATPLIKLDKLFDYDLLPLQKLLNKSIIHKRIFFFYIGQSINLTYCCCSFFFNQSIMFDIIY
jgi:predicted nucleic acid-binding Zn finger protein